MIEKVQGAVPGSMIKMSRNKEVDNYFLLANGKFEADLLWAVIYFEI